MSKRNGNKARASRQQKRKMLQRKHSRELGESPESKSMAPSPANVGERVVSSQLRQLIVNGKADPNALEIVVYQVPQGEQK